MNKTAKKGTKGGKPPSTLFTLGKFADEDYITKQELCEAFKCSPRTMQRMVERFEIPPPIWLAGRKVWIAGKLREWIAQNIERSETEAKEFAKKMRVFDT
jgi:predicted DNA-binding transcriptional regulator AlpA